MALTSYLLQLRHLLMVRLQLMSEDAILIGEELDEVGGAAGDGLVVELKVRLGCLWCWGWVRGGGVGRQRGGTGDTTAKYRKEKKEI